MVRTSIRHVIFAALLTVGLGCSGEPETVREALGLEETQTATVTAPIDQEFTLVGKYRAGENRSAYFVEIVARGAVGTLEVTRQCYLDHEIGEVLSVPCRAGRR